MNNVLGRVINIVGNDTLMIFGESGSGKTTFATALAIEGAKTFGHGKVIFIDCERNIVDENIFRENGIDYEFISDIEKFYTKLINLKKGYRMIIIDSIGQIVAFAFAEKSRGETGMWLQRLYNLCYRLKTYAQINDAIVIVTNQPTSPYMKGEVDPFELKPRGGQIIYLFKEIWRTSRDRYSENKTVCGVYAWRSRRYPFRKRLFTLEISEEGVKVISHV